MSAVANQQNGTAAQVQVPSGAMVRHSSVEPSTMDELKDFAITAAATQFFGAKTPEQALIIAMAGKDLGFSYTQALRAFYVVKGRPSLSADGMVAVCLARPDICEYFRPVEVTEKKATWETKRVGSAPVRYDFSEADARKAGIWGDMYEKHPKRMLSARAKSYLARDTYSEILMGLITEDEAEEIAVDRGPVKQVSFNVVQPAAPPTEAASNASLENLRALLLDCDTEGKFKHCAAETRRAHERGDLSDDEYAAFKADYKEIRARVLPKATDAPKVEPPKAAVTPPATPAQTTIQDIRDAEIVDDGDRPDIM